jgi:uncharacterized protein YndB with AHSA1/START domain
MLVTIAVIIAVVIAAILLLASRKPDRFVVQRSANIQAPPEKIFPLINDFHRWPVWSPYEKLDPAMQRTIGGAAVGTGATYGWVSKGKGGVGNMAITDSVPPSRIAIDLNFTKPFRANNKVLFTLDRQGAATHVTWRMEGPAVLFHKVMQLFINMDRMVGRDFEAGLAAMKAATEA